MSYYRLGRYLQRWGLGLGASLGILLYAGVAQAAERVVWQYRIFQGSLSVDELTTLANTGEASPALNTYLRLARKNPEQIRHTLNQQATVDVRLLDRVLNSPVGNLVLDQIGEAIHTPSRTADRQALRSALVLSASDDNRISIIELLQKYPTQEIYVDGDRLATAYRQIQDLQNNVGRLLQGIELLRTPSSTGAN